MRLPAMSAGLVMPELLSANVAASSTPARRPRNGRRAGLQGFMVASGVAGESIVGNRAPSQHADNPIYQSNLPMAATIDQLRAFVALAETSQFTRAADRLD